MKKNEYKINKYNAIIAILITIICPPIGLIVSLISIRKDINNWKSYILCIAWAMAIFAYCYEPTVDSDLVRYFAYAKTLENNSFLDAINAKLYGVGNLYVFNFFCWIFTKVGDIRLLPAVSTFCVYYIGMYVTCDFGKDNNIERNKISSYIVTILLMVSFYSVVNNVRNIWAFSIVGLAIYRDCYKNKRNLLTIALYVLPVFMHTSAVVIILLRLVIIISGKLRVFISAAIVLVPSTLSLLSSSLAGISSGNIIINLLINTINSGNNYYSHSNAAWALIVSKSGAAKAMKMLYMILAIYEIVSYFRWYRNKNNTTTEYGYLRNVRIIDFPFLCFLLAVACFPMVMPEYWRFAYLGILFGAAFYFYSTTIWGNLSGYVLAFIRVLSIGILMLWIRDLFLYSNVGALLYRAFIANPIVIILLNEIGNGIGAVL